MVKFIVFVCFLMVFVCLLVVFVFFVLFSLDLCVEDAFVSQCPHILSYSLYFLCYVLANYSSETVVCHCQSSCLEVLSL